MKIELTNGDPSIYMRLVPEDDGDRKLLKELALRTTNRAHSFYCRGVAYLDPAVEFHITPQGRND